MARRRDSRPAALADGQMPEHLAAGPCIEAWVSEDERPRPQTYGGPLESWRAMTARSRWWDELREWARGNGRDPWAARAEVRCTTPHRAEFVEH